jgi:23S rRNA (adenine2503-C2)-methyltransferase
VSKTRRRISFEWALINGINDTDEQAQKLSRLLKPFIANNIAMCHVNVIQLNPTRRYEGNAGKYSQALHFQSILTQNGIPCTIRVRRGIEIQAGCGQLASE